LPTLSRNEAELKFSVSENDATFFGNLYALLIEFEAYYTQPLCQVIGDNFDHLIERIIYRGRPLGLG
jgi:hypothetical protein